MRVHVYYIVYMHSVIITRAIEYILWEKNVCQELHEVYIEPEAVCQEGHYVEDIQLDILLQNIPYPSGNCSSWCSVLRRRYICCLLAESIGV